MFAVGDLLSQFPALATCSKASPAVRDSSFGTVSQKYFLLHAALVMAQRKVTNAAGKTGIWWEFINIFQR